MITAIRPSIQVDSTSHGADLFTLDGDFDETAWEQIEESIGGALATSDSDAILDLRGVCSVETGVLRDLVHMLRRSQHGERRIVLIRPNPYVWRTFEEAGLDDAFVTCDCVGDAVLSLSLPAPLGR